MKLHLSIIQFIGLIIPRRLRADWRQEWEAELQWREAQLAEWDKLDWRNKRDLLRHSLGALMDALWLQPKRLEDEMFQDLRYGLRMLRTHPGFTLTAALTLALGIGVNTAILSTVNGFIIRPLPVEKPEELAAPVWGSKNAAEVWGNFSYANYVDLRDQNKTFSGLLAWSTTSAAISSSESRDSSNTSKADIIWGEIVTGNYFDVLGVKPALGRSFLPEEDRTPNTHPVVVISNLLWQNRFNSDQSIVGKTIYLNGSPFTVIGVAPEYFKGVKFAIRQSFWVPAMMTSKFGAGVEWQTSRRYTMFTLLGRLKPGVTMKQAEADLNVTVENLGRLYPQTNAATKVQVIPERNARFSKTSKLIRLCSWLALCVSGLVLIVACANVANLMLARAAERAREIGIRLAIGAGRFRIVRQLLTESVVLALLGGVLGWIFAYWGTGLIYASIPPFPQAIDLDINPDLNVLKWMLLVSLLTGVIFGLAPAWLASRPNLVAVIKGDAAGQAAGKSRRRWNLRSLLVVTQVAISIIVLICSGLFLRSLNKALKTDPGFNVDNLATMMLDPGLLSYDDDAGKRFYAELLRRIETQPGVRSASLIEYFLLGDSARTRGPVIKEGEPEPLPNQGTRIGCSIVAPKYFETMKTPLLLGRDFTERDNSDAPRVVIVNQEYAREFYGREQNALGKRFRLTNNNEPLMEIVGVAKDGLYRSLYEDPQPFMFLPEYQNYQSQMTLVISANSAGDLTLIAESVRREIGKLDARAPVFGLQVGKENLSYAYWGPRLAAGIATTFGLLALLLATTGLYSVMSYNVAQRTREIGVRMALGAQISDVLKLILRQGLTLAVVGAVIGVIGAIALTRMLSSLLLGVGATDPMTFAGVTIFLIVVGLLACWIPARQATKVDPMKSLRQE